MSATRFSRLTSVLLLCMVTASLSLSQFSNAFPLADSGANFQTSLLAQDIDADLPQPLSLPVDHISSKPILKCRDASPTSTSTTTSSAVATASASSVSTPTPFDSSLGNNFTQASCPIFFENFLNNPTFKSCVPFSLLLQNSDAFFEATASNLTLDPVLDDSCNAPFQTCASLMSSLAGQLISQPNCANDFGLENPLVVQAYRGLLSYSPMHNASCLKANPTSKSADNNFPYCYASSLNSSSGADSMLYFLPLGLGLPGGTSISCSSCTQETMAIYASAATDPKSPLNTEYLPAASMINEACGANFVNASPSITKAASTPTANSANQVLSPQNLLAVTLAMAVLAFDWT